MWPHVCTNYYHQSSSKHENISYLSYWWTKNNSVLPKACARISFEQNSMLHLLLTISAAWITVLADHLF